MQPQHYYECSFLICSEIRKGRQRVVGRAGVREALRSVMPFALRLTELAAVHVTLMRQMKSHFLSKQLMLI